MPYGEKSIRSLVQSEDPWFENGPFFVGVLGVPLLIMSASLLRKSDYWWNNSLLMWFFVMFGVLILRLLY